MLDAAHSNLFETAPSAELSSISIKLLALEASEKYKKRKDSSPQVEDGYITDITWLQKQQNRGSFPPE